MVNFKYLLLLATMLIASLPAGAIGYKANYSDHPEENGQCLQLSYMPGAYFNVTLTDKVGWAKAAGAKNTYIKAQLYFYTDEFLTQPASICADDNGYLVDAVENRQLRQTVRTNFLTQELRSTSDFYFFIPQQVIDKMSQKYANNKEGQCKIYFKLRLTNRLGTDYMKVTKSFKPGSFTLKVGGRSSSGFRKYGCWVEYVGNRTERSLHFDNPDAKEGLYNFMVHYYGTNLLKSKCGGKYHEPYSFKLSFYQDAAMTKPFLMDFSKPVEMQDGYEVASNMWEAPNNQNPDRRNYIKGTRSNLDPFDIYVREVVFDGFFDQGCGVYDVDTFVTVYFKYEPDISSLINASTQTVGSFRWWHIPPPKRSIKIELEDSRDFGENKKCQCGGTGSCGDRLCECGCNMPKDPEGCDCGGTGSCGDLSCECGCNNKPEPQNPPEGCQCGGTGSCGDRLCKCGCKWPTPQKTNDTSCEHEWSYEDRRISNWCPYQTRFSYGSINIDLQLVQDEKNDSVVFYVMSAPVSQALYEQEMDENPSDTKNASQPVTNVSANDALFFVQRLNSDVSQDYGIKFRVPKKDEWLLAASQLESMGKDLDEVLDEEPKHNTVRDKEGFVESDRVVGFYAGSRRASGQPAIKTIAQSSSPTTCIRLIADQMIESALPYEVSVATDAKYGTKTNFRKITRTLQVKRCKTCGKTISYWLD